MKLLAVVILLGLHGSVAAEVNCWTIDYVASRLGFTAEQAGAKFQGEFKTFKANVRFDPDALAQSSAEVLIDTASITTSDKERDGILRGTGWFETDAFPQAKFTAHEFAANAAGFDAHGELSVRGVGVPVTFHFTVVDTNGHIELHGSAELDRIALGLGLGDWADTKWIGQHVEVDVVLIGDAVVVEVVRDFPHRVKEIPHCYIELSDGVRLAARMWLPEDAAQQPVPAILEYLPYRKGDGTAIDDATRHHYFAGHGFVSVRVDIRGSGDSDGVLDDEYSAIELTDAVEVIAWLATQPWCNGRVGMLGISWGGFNALQVAALAPPALGAVISVCSTDDRYADDVHYMGSAILAQDMLGWAMTLLANNAQPPDPLTVGEVWRDLWQQRLEATPAFIDRWLMHRQRDDYWRHGSVCEDYAAIRTPVLIVGGWADGYTNPVLRLLEGLSAPARAIIGPWAHHWPHAGLPGPTIGFLAEAVRWWDHWLNGRNRGVLEEPRLRVWVQEHTAPQSQHWPGKWVGTDLDAGEFETGNFYLDPAGARLTVAPGGDTMLTVPWEPAHGSCAGAWVPFGPTDMAVEQSADDARCMCFDSEPLTGELTLLGRPELMLDIESAIAGTQVVARLCEVAPDGVSLLLCWGVLVLDGGSVAARLQLNAVGHRLRSGYRLRLALASSYWPVLWPAPECARAQVRTGSSRLELPIWRRDSIGAQAAVTFSQPECAERAPYEVLRSGSATALGANSRRVDRGRIRHANGIEVDIVTVDEAQWTGGTATVRCNRAIEMARENWCTRIGVVGEMTDADGGFDVAVALTASLNDVQCADRRWRFRFERRCG